MRKIVFELIRKASVALVILLISIPSFSLIHGVNDTYTLSEAEHTYPYPGDDWGWRMVGADLAHELGETGEGVRIAILDTGIDYNHPDLRDKMWEGIGYDFVNNNDDPMDNDGHGTHVAGIVASVAPGAELMALKVLEEEGGRWQEVSEAIRYARNNGADIITMSFGAQRSLLARAVEIQMNFAYDWDGIFLVAAAGNDDTDTEHYPAGYNSVVSVSAVTHEKEKASYSNYGDWIELAAPGGDTEKRILSTVPGGEYGSKMGTSMAAPYVAGVAAIMLGADPGLSQRDIRENLREQAIDIGDPNHFGHGLVNAYRAAGGDVPSYPDDLWGSSGNERVDLRWYEPRFQGADDIEGFNVYRSLPEGSPDWIAEVPANSLSFLDTNVSNDVTYEYRVTAYNSYGESRFSVSAYLTPREGPVEPSKVRDLRVVSEELPVELVWSSPMDDGGSPITHYNIYRDGVLIDNTENDFFRDREASGEVIYTVTASNSVGEGEASEPVQVNVISTEEIDQESSWPFDPIPLEPHQDWWIFALFGLSLFLILMSIFLAIIKKPKGPV